MRTELLRLSKAYGIPLSLLGKEVLVDADLLEEAAGFLGPSTVPFAFPGLFFKYERGTPLERDERRLVAVEREYGLKGELFTPPEYRLHEENVFLEPESVYARETLAYTLALQPRRLFVSTRESVLISLIAEPGWREYSPITVLSDLFYEIKDIFRLENQAFFPSGKSSMGVAFLALKRPYPRALDFLRFLKRLFTQRKKKVQIGGLKTDRRVDQLEPPALLELYETTLAK